MTPSMKKLCIFGLAEGLGRLIVDKIDLIEMPEHEKELTIWNAKEMIRTGNAAIKNCHVKTSYKTLIKVQKKVEEIAFDDEEILISGMLSFLFCGLNDLAHHCNDKENIMAVEDAALNFLTLYDPNLEHEEMHTEAIERYHKWIESA